MADKRGEVSRRDVLRGAGVAAVLGTVGTASAQDAKAAAAKDGIIRVGPGKLRLGFEVNGKPTVVSVEPRTTLLDALRDHLDLAGTKRGCDRGACGACTVFMNGKPINSCTMLAIDAVGTRITTIEGLARDGQLHNVQTAFVKEDATQCGFCTSGMVMSVAHLLDQVAAPTEEDFRQAVSGNLCRCGTYSQVFAACKEAAR